MKAALHDIAAAIALGIVIAAIVLLLLNSSDLRQWETHSAIEKETVSPKPYDWNRYGLAGGDER